MARAVTELPTNTTEVINMCEKGGDMSALAQRARLADEAEHEETISVALRRHPWAVFWALMMSLCVIMEGYDTNLLSNFYSYPQFTKKFGTYFPELAAAGKFPYQIPANWQVGLGNATGVGAFLGGLLNGVLVDRFGHKRVTIGALVALVCFMFLLFFAPNVQTLVVGELLCGFPWGIFATVSPAYASEVLPLSLRVYMTSWTNMCFIIGQLIVAALQAGMVNIPNDWSYRGLFAIQWFWPAILILTLFFAPESPWYLVRKGWLDEARQSLRRLNSVDEELIESNLSLIIHTDNMEQEHLQVKTSYWQCFRGVDRRRAEIACMAFAGQVTVGLYFAYNSTYFFSQVGLTTDQVYRLNVGGNGLALFGTLLSWFLILPHFGRRTTYLWGMGILTLILLLIGVLNVKTNDTSIGMAQAVLTLVWTFVFQLSVGQLGWALPAEVGSTRLRQKTVVLARNAYYLVTVVAAVLEPYFINPTAWNLKGYTGFFWGGTGVSSR